MALSRSELLEMLKRPQSAVVTITSELARWIVENLNSPENRLCRDSIVERWVGIFERREYILTHQGIAFAENGHLVDGQHRLAALAQMPDGFAIEIEVTTGLSPRAMMGMDQGLIRSMSDIIREPTSLVAVANYMLIVVRNTLLRPTPKMLAPYVTLARRPLAELLEGAEARRRYFTSAPFRTAAVMVSIGGGDFDFAKGVYRSLVNGEFDNMTAAAKGLYRAVAEGRVSEQRADIYSRAAKVMNPRSQHQERIQVKNDRLELDAARKILQRRLGDMRGVMVSPD